MLEAAIEWKVQVEVQMEEDYKESNLEVETEAGDSKVQVGEEAIESKVEVETEAGNSKYR